MKENLYYNPASANKDSRSGMGYAKSQKIPSFGTGVGSMWPMGSSETGIYVMPHDEDEDVTDAEYPLEDDDIDKFVVMINRDVRRADPTFWPRADRSSLGHSGNSSAASALALTEFCTKGANSDRMPGVSSGISPFSSRALYPCGLDAPIGTGLAGQAFRTTGPAKKTGTQYGSSRAPVDTEHDFDEEVPGFFEIIDLDPEERAVMKQNAKIMKVLNRLEEVDSIHSYIK